MLRIREVNDTSELMDLRETWDDILRKGKDDNIFLTWEWLSTWWKHYGRGRKLVVLLAEDGNEIVAIAPFMYSVSRLFGFKLSKIEFMGSCHTDYRNLILAKRKADSLKLFLKHLCTLTWDCLELKEIPESAESLLLLRGMSKKGHAPREMVCGKCPYVDINASWETYFARLSRNMRKNLRRRMRRLAQRHRVRFTKYDVGSTEEAVLTLVSLETKRWRSMGLRGDFVEDPRFHDFLLDVSRRFAERDWLSLFSLEVDERPVSSTLCFEYNRTLYKYHSGFDPEYPGVGNLLTMHVIEYGFRRGLAKVDLLRGAHRFKYDWTETHRNNIEITYVKNSLLPVVYDRTKRSDNSLLQCLKRIYVRHRHIVSGN